MPDFFLISGLFLAQVIDRDWRTYLDRKVVHFVYFYLLWTAIQFALKAPGLVQGHGVAGVAWLYLETFWEPFGTLWFIYLLPIFFVVTKLAHGLRIPVLADLARRGGARDRAHPHRLDRDRRVRGRFVYFYTGYILAPRIFALAAQVQAQPEAALAGLDDLGPASTASWCSTGYAGLAVRLARARPCRRGRGGGGLGAAGAEPPVRAAALLRRALDRHLSRVLPRHGGEPHRAAQVRLDRRHRHHLRDRDARGHRRRARSCTGRCAARRCAFLFERPERFWIAPRKPLRSCSPRSSRRFRRWVSAESA